MSFILSSRFLTKRILVSSSASRNRLFDIGRRVFAKLAPVTQAKCPPAPCRPTEIVRPIEQLEYETHDDKNFRLKRPLSPHLSIYAPQYTSIFSIIHRVTGTVFATYAMLFAATTFFSPYDYEAMCQMIEDQNFHPALIYFGRFTIAFPLIYHSCNGVRHLLWDTGNFLGLKEVLLTGILMLICALSLIGVFVFLLPLEEKKTEEPVDVKGKKK